MGVEEVNNTRQVGKKALGNIQVLVGSHQSNCAKGEWSLSRLAIIMICFDDSSSARAPLYQNKHNLNDGLKPPSANLVCISDLST